MLVLPWGWLGGEAEGDGKPDVAIRLRGSGPTAYPGLDEVKDIAQVMGGWWLHIRGMPRCSMGKGHCLCMCTSQQVQMVTDITPRIGSYYKAGKVEMQDTRQTLWAICRRALLWRWMLQIQRCKHGWKSQERFPVLMTLLGSSLICMLPWHSIVR